MAYQSSHRIRDEIMAVGQMYSNIGGMELASRYLDDPLGKEKLMADLGLRAARREHKKNITRVPKICSGIQLTRNEADDYSLVDLILSSAHGNALGRVTGDAKFERDVSLELQRQGRWSTPIYGEVVPFAIFGRDFSVGTPSEAGNIVGTAKDLSRAPFLFAAESALSQAGATIITGLADTLSLPRLGPKLITTEPGWVAETASAPEVSEISDELPLPPRRLAGTFIVSLQALRQGGAAFENLLRREIARRLLSKLDAAAFGIANGSGDAPAGLLSVLPGVTSVVGGTNGAELTNQHLSQMEYYANMTGVTDRAGFIFNPRTQAWLRPKLSENDFNYAQPGGALWGYRTLTTQYLSDTLTKGTSTDCSGLVYSSDWAEFVIAIYGPGVDLFIDRVTMADQGKCRVVASIHANFGLNQPGRFSVMADARLPVV
ncbi:MAG: hypothetical protein AMXMBFR31_08810 [Candidatus Desulfobacillus denitrificans]